jgi:hypothetical protein
MCISALLEICESYCHVALILGSVGCILFVSTSTQRMNTPSKESLNSISNGSQELLLS